MTVDWFVLYFTISNQLIQILLALNEMNLLNTKLLLVRILDLYAVRKYSLMIVHHFEWFSKYHVSRHYVKSWARTLCLSPHNLIYYVSLL